MSKYKIQLRSDRIIHLRSLRQWEFYSGLIEGLPTVERNKSDLEYLLTKEQEKAQGRLPLLIPPVERILEDDPQDPYPFGKPAAFPDIVCIALFDSLNPARDKSKDCSELTVIWFQNEFAFPIDSEIMEQLRSIDWEREATDYFI